MPNPKDPEKLDAYRRKMSEIAKSKGYGKWMKGRKLTAESVAKMREKHILISNMPEERQRRSEYAKANGYGKWMAGRSANPKVIESAKKRKRKSYVEIYGPERAEEEAQKRRDSNRRRHEGKINPHKREKHNADYHYAEWRKAVFKRDNFQRCGKRGGVLQAHHIKSWAKFPELRFDVANGKTLCESPCHWEEHRIQK
jgi:hypothetical protein